jgi:hypothetical protein
MLAIFSIVIIIFLVFVDIFLVWRKIKEAERQSLRSESDAAEQISNHEDASSRKTTPRSPETSGNFLRILAGILLSLTLLFLLLFSEMPSMAMLPIESHPLEYAFGIVLFATISIFILLWKREHSIRAAQNIRATEHSHQWCNSASMSFCRIVCGMLAFVFFIVTAILIAFLGFRSRGWILIFLAGGYGILFLWIAITGKRPK